MQYHMIKSTKQTLKSKLLTPSGTKRSYCESQFLIISAEVDWNAHITFYCFSSFQRIWTFCRCQLPPWDVVRKAETFTLLVLKLINYAFPYLLSNIWSYNNSIKCGQSLKWWVIKRLCYKWAQSSGLRLLSSHAYRALAVRTDAPPTCCS